MISPIGRKAAVDQYRVYNIELIDLQYSLRLSLSAICLALPCLACVLDIWKQDRWRYRMDGISEKLIVPSEDERSRYVSVCT